MAETSGPFDSGGFTEDAWDFLARAFTSDGVIMSAGSWTELKLTLSSGLNGSLAVGNHAVRGFLYRNDAAKILDFTKGGTTPPNVTNPRIDLVVLRLDRAANSVTAQIKTGTPAASPVAPTVQQDATLWEDPIATVLIPANAVVLSTITDLRSYAYVPPNMSWSQAPKTASQNFTAGSMTKATWTATGLLGGIALFDDANDRFIAPVNGLYSVSYYAPSTGGTSQTGCMAALFKNGTQLAVMSGPGPGAVYYPSMALPKHYLAAGDYWEAFIRADGNSTAMVPTTAGRFNFAYEGPAYL